MEKDSLQKNHQLHLITYSDKGFKNVFDRQIMKSLKVNPEYEEGIFTPENIELFKKQLDTILKTTIQICCQGMIVYEVANECLK